MAMLELKNIEKTDYYYQEAIKTLRTNLQFCGSSIKTIMFTSTMPSEGKSSTTLAVAAALSSIGKRVLFVDADIRKSMMVKTHEIAGHNYGLSQYLSGQKTLEEVVYETNVENMDMVLAGPYSPNPAELLEDETFAKLVSWGRERYDYVIIDTPPMANLIDGAIIAKECDGAVMVIESGNISYRIAQRVKSQLEKSGCRILGAVLNRAGNGYAGGYYKKYYGKYYGKYGKYDKYYQNQSERANEEVRQAASDLETAMTAEPEQKEISMPKAEEIRIPEPENGRKAGCSRKRRDTRN